MKKLLAGVARFQHTIVPRYKEHFARIAGRQEPFALFITCADSRVLPNLITQTDPGDLFLCRDVGNIVPPHGSVYGGVSATIEYSVCVLNVRDIIVCGHSDCGAMRALLDPDSLKALPGVLEWLRYAEDPHRTVTANCSHLPPDQQLARLIEENVITQLEHLKTHPAVINALAAGKLNLHGWVYDIESGAVRVFDEKEGRFQMIELEVEDSPPVEDDGFELMAR